LAVLAGAAIVQRQTPVPPPANTVVTAPVTQALAEAAEGELEEAEQIFAYQVLADAAKRSMDGVRFIDALLVGLLAAQAAILAIYVDKVRTSEPFAAGIVRPMDWALIVAAVGLVLTFWAKEGPDAGYFAASFPKDPGATRNAVMKLFERIVDRNGILRVFKVLLLAVSLGVTLWDVLAATGFAPLGSRG
jgi:hypothetical protein